MKETQDMSAVELSDYIRENTTVTDFTLRVRNYLREGVVGINDLDYVPRTKINGEKLRDPCFGAWCAIIGRCYDKEYQKRHPTYSDITVCDEWLNSCMAFRKWWVVHQVDGWAIDKDILTDSKVYSPDTCIYIPQWLNNIAATGGREKQNNLPKGVWVGTPTKDGRMYTSQVKYPNTNKAFHVGNFFTAEEARAAYLTKKLEMIKQLKPDMDKIDLRIYPRIIEIISRD